MFNQSCLFFTTAKTQRQMKALHHIDERLVKDSNLGTTLVFPLIWSASWNNPINPGMMRGYLYTDIYLHGNWPLSDGRVQFVHTLFKGNLVIGLRKDDREGDREGGVRGVNVHFWSMTNFTGEEINNSRELFFYNRFKSAHKVCIHVTI